MDRTSVHVEEKTFLRASTSFAGESSFSRRYKALRYNSDFFFNEKATKYMLLYLLCGFGAQSRAL